MRDSAPDTTLPNIHKLALEQSLASAVLPPDWEPSVPLSPLEVRELLEIWYSGARFQVGLSDDPTNKRLETEARQMAKGLTRRDVGEASFRQFQICENAFHAERGKRRSMAAQDGDYTAAKRRKKRT